MDQQEKKPKPCKSVGEHTPWHPKPFPDEYGPEFAEGLEDWAEHLKRWMCEVHLRLWPDDPTGKHPPPDPPFG